MKINKHYVEIQGEAFALFSMIVEAALLVAWVIGGVASDHFSAEIVMAIASSLAVVLLVYVLIFQKEFRNRVYHYDM